jgi:short-subunit dehydrogenase
MHRLHVLTPLALSHAALENLSAGNQPAGKIGIINVSSIASFGAEPFHVGYGATKTWLSAFTEGLAIELAAQGSPVRMQALCPGLTRSEFVGRLGMDRWGIDKAWEKIPQSMWMTANAVVDESLGAFDRNQLFVIPGWRYRLLVRVLKLVPPAWKRKLGVLRIRPLTRPRPALAAQVAAAK